MAIDLDANRRRLKELERDGEARRARIARVVKDADLRNLTKATSNLNSETLSV